MMLDAHHWRDHIAHRLLHGVAKPEENELVDVLHLVQGSVELVDQLDVGGKRGICEWRVATKMVHAPIRRRDWYGCWLRDYLRQRGTGQDPGKRQNADC